MSDLEKLVALTIDRGFRIHHDLGPGLLRSIYERLRLRRQVTLPSCDFLSRPQTMFLGKTQRDK